MHKKLRDIPVGTLFRASGWQMGSSTPGIYYKYGSYVAQIADAEGKLFLRNYVYQTPDNVVEGFEQIDTSTVFGTPIFGPTPQIKAEPQCEPKKQLPASTDW